MLPVDQNVNLMYILKNKALNLERQLRLPFYSLATSILMLLAVPNFTPRAFQNGIIISLLFLQAEMMEGK